MTQCYGSPCTWPVEGLLISSYPPSSFLSSWHKQAIKICAVPSLLFRSELRIRVPPLDFLSCNLKFYPRYPVLYPHKISRAKAPANTSMYTRSPSIQEMSQNRKYRKTLDRYRGTIQSGMTISLKSLEDFPAPIQCPFCRVSVITQTEIRRSGSQKYDIHQSSSYHTLSTQDDP